MKYLNNKVLLPRLEYRALICLLDKRTCDKVHQPVLRLAKWKADIALTATNSITNYKELLGIKSLWQRHTEQMLAEWVIRINDTGVLGQSTRLRLKKAQQKICSPKPI